MRIDVLTLFPEMLQGPLEASIVGRARARGLVDIRLWNLRDFTTDKHRTVDDSPYGGGAGMVLKPEPVFRAVEHIASEGPRPHVVLLDPQGPVLVQERVEELARRERLLLLCGHYEGFDERIRTLADEELSIGDYVLTGGELPALVVIDAVVRLLPGVLGHPDSARVESFSEGLLDHPHYTRPYEFRGMRVPDVLLSGDHEAIRRWRRRERLRRTLLRRPDLLARARLTDEDRRWLAELQAEGVAPDGGPAPGGGPGQAGGAGGVSFTPPEGLW